MSKKKRLAQAWTNAVRQAAKQERQIQAAFLATFMTSDWSIRMNGVIFYNHINYPILINAFHLCLASLTLS